MTDLKAVEAFFLDAVQHTYAANAAKTSVAELPGSKVCRYARGEFLYVDIWFSSKNKSFGQTTIFHRCKPVWGMQYRGFWTGNDERVIPFQKRALLAATEFVGGRGPHKFVEGTLVYRNFPLKKGFDDFAGEEEIREGSTLLFWHSYSGLAL